jgi:glycerol-3-phosphate dehydrogenase
MWRTGWRDSIWSQLDQTWDLIIIGGGITGAGILHEAAHAGLHALLVEAHDFASGTSSRSSKMVHGGLRYLKNGQIRLILESVHERQRLLSEGRGLITPLGTLLACYQGDAIPEWVFGAGLVLYDLLALKWGHRHYDAYDMHDLCPPLDTENLAGGYRYFDAQTDDARLVLRLIQEAVQDGGVALNYAAVRDLLRTRQGSVCGVVLEDRASPDSHNMQTLEIRARQVINAAGAWADDLRSAMGGQARLRRLRGSHLIFPAARLPLTRSVSFLHPVDNRPVFAFPWEGITLVGTTDVDMQEPLTTDPSISQSEFDYLLQAVQFAFSSQELSLEDVQCTYAGVRPVVHTGKTDPSKESREHVLWHENNLLTVAGGKLTTFRRMAHDALNKVRANLPHHPRFNSRQRVLAATPVENYLPSQLSPSARLRLAGRHGLETPAFVADTPANELVPIGSSNVLWAELRWAARLEAVVHIDDLLLRRARLGLLLPKGGLDYMDRIRTIVQAELGWDDTRWQNEIAAYARLWKKCYYLP